MVNMQEKADALWKGVYFRSQRIFSLSPRKFRKTYKMQVAYLYFNERNLKQQNYWKLSISNSVKTRYTECQNSRKPHICKHFSTDKLLKKCKIEESLAIVEKSWVNENSAKVRLLHWVTLKNQKENTSVRNTPILEPFFGHM